MKAVLVNSANRIPNLLQSHRESSLTAATSNSGGQAFSGSPMLELEFAQLSDTGKVRGRNEDFLGHAQPSTAEQLRSHGWLFALADGCGGHDRGEVAARIAVDTLVSNFYATQAGEPSSSLERLVQLANDKIHNFAATANTSGSSMATTLVACAVLANFATVAHVGDSRCYLIRSGHVAVLTRDHTIVHEQVKLGLLSEAEAAESEARHQLSRSLGAESVVNTDIDKHQLQAGDVLLLASDGLYESVTGKEMAAVTARFSDLLEAARALVALACQKDGSDNISLQIIRIKSVERAGMYRGRPYSLR
jgi:serine/threonine protein phosphatase PrpC